MSRAAKQDGLAVFEATNLTTREVLLAASHLPIHKIRSTLASAHHRKTSHWSLKEHRIVCRTIGSHLSTRAAHSLMREHVSRAAFRHFKVFKLREVC